jgi:DNA-directed RNA polymerase specialized sigma24 family protein
LNEEINRLPEKYRFPVILGYLEGKTNEEISQILESPVGTVKGRLRRARILLRSRLLRRGLDLLAAILLTAVAGGTVLSRVCPRMT